jgi:hypothetical protein
MKQEKRTYTKAEKLQLIGIFRDKYGESEEEAEKTVNRMIKEGTPFLDILLKLDDKYGRD